MNGIDYFKLAINRFIEFDGRSRRSEFWYFVLGNIILTIGAGILDGIMGTGLFDNVVSLVLFLPGLAVSIRRLHDIGKSGWWILIALTGIGFLILLFWYAQEGEPGENEWGPDPLTEDYGYSDHFDDSTV